MNITAMLIALLAVLPAAGLVAWVWFAMAQVEDELRSHSMFGGPYVKSETTLLDKPERVTCPIPG